MIPFAAIKYMVYSAIMVISIVVGLRCLFAHEMRRELWRTGIKRHIYFSRKRFKTTSLLFGWCLLFIGLYVAYFQILDLFDA